MLLWLQGLPKPVIKTEPMDETPQIEEFNSQPSLVDEKENIEDNFEGNKSEVSTT